MGARITLQTIADAVGVSRTTVSNAYNRPDQLAPALRARIFATARSLGYAGPDPAARRLRSSSRDPVGVLLAGRLESAFAEPELAPLLGGLARAVESAGLGLVLVPGSGVRDAVVRSLCVCGLEGDDPRLVIARERGLPLVVVDGPRLPGHAYVGYDVGGAAAQLRAWGRRRVAVVGADGDALAAAGIEVVAEGPDVPVVTVRRPLERMGEVAGQLLTAAGGAAGEVVLPCEVVYGTSSGPLSI